MTDLPNYVYVASSWRNPMQQAVVHVLGAAGIDCYDFRNPEGGTGFSWREVKTDRPSAKCKAPRVVRACVEVDIDGDPIAAEAGI